MNWLYKLERRFGRFGIPNLMLYVAAGQAIVWLVVMFAYYPLYFLLDLNRTGLFAGQVWRLVSFVFLPPLTTSPIYVVLEIYLLYWLGSALERTWGSFKFTVYFLLGMIGAWLGCLITGSAGNTALYYSLFFAFAYLYPETQLLLFFVLPVKVKWLGWISAALYLFQWITAPLGQKLAMLAGLLGFWVFFGKGGIGRIRQKITDYRRRKAWQNQCLQ